MSRIASAPEPEGARNKFIAQEGVDCTTKRGFQNRRGMHNKAWIAQQAWNAQQLVDCTTTRGLHNKAWVAQQGVERSESSEASLAKRVERSEFF